MSLVTDYRNTSVQLLGHMCMIVRWSTSTLRFNLAACCMLVYWEFYFWLAPVCYVIIQLALAHGLRCLYAAAVFSAFQVNTLVLARLLTDSIKCLHAGGNWFAFSATKCLSRCGSCCVAAPFKLAPCGWALNYLWLAPNSPAVSGRRLSYVQGMCTCGHLPHYFSC